MNNLPDYGTETGAQGDNRRSLHSGEHRTVNSTSPTSRFGASELPFNDAHDKSSRTRKDAGLPLYSSPSTGARLSERQLSQMSKMHRREYMEITKRHVIPKVVSLATRLVPSVRQEVDRLENQMGSTKNGLSGERDSGSHSSLKSTGLDEEDMESGLQRTGDGDENDHSLCLPQSAALAAIGPGSPSEEGVRKGFVPVEAIAASLDADVALLDMEADALLQSIRNVPSSSSKTGRKPSLRQSNVSEEDDNQSITSMDTIDDDDIGGEIRRLGQSMRGLRLDLASADWDSMRRDIQRDRIGSFDSLSLAPSSEQGEGSSEHSRRWFSSLTSRLALNRKTMKQVGLDDENVGGNAALYWAIALVWAIVILLAGHVKFNTFGDGDGWSEFLDWSSFNFL